MTQSIMAANLAALLLVPALAVAGTTRDGAPLSAPATSQGTDLRLAGSGSHSGHGDHKAAKTGDGTHAGMGTIGHLAVSGAYVRASIGRAPNSAAYMTITAMTGEDRLLKVESPAAKAVELHTVIHTGDVMKMTPVETVPVSADAPAELAPGGYHIMLMGLVEPLKVGTMIPMTLTFANAGTLELMVPVQKSKSHSH